MHSTSMATIIIINPFHRCPVLWTPQEAGTPQLLSALGATVLEAQVGVGILSLGTYPLSTTHLLGWNHAPVGALPSSPLPYCSLFYRHATPPHTSCCYSKRKHIKQRVLVSPPMYKSPLNTFPSSWPQNRPLFLMKKRDRKYLVIQEYFGLLLLYAILPSSRHKGGKQEILAVRKMLHNLTAFIYSKNIS